jgi:predicted RNA-binding Zn ribbon-like protein
MTVGRSVWNNLKPAPGSLALVQDFVNTRNRLEGGELLGTIEETNAALSERGLIGEQERLGEADRQRLITFREGLRGLLVAHTGAPVADVGRLEAMTSSSALRVRFLPDGRPALESAAGGGPVERIIGCLLAEVVRAEAEGTWARLKACRNEDCGWAFYDASKNRSGTWCDMDVCGARHKMRAYRRRKSASR